MAELFLPQYFDDYQHLLVGDEHLFPRLQEIKSVLVSCHQRGNKIIIVGNGGSAAIASHVSVDLSKNAGVRCCNFNEANLITCLANDYGYDRWLEKAIEIYGDPGDALIAISSSGCSENILKACRTAKKLEFSLVLTLTGFSPDNPLRKLGDINLWVDSKAYNLVENIHQFWLLTVVDMIIGKAEYSAVGEGCAS